MPPHPAPGPVMRVCPHSPWSLLRPAAASRPSASATGLQCWARSLRASGWGKGRGIQSGRTKGHGHKRNWACSVRLAACMKVSGTKCSGTRGQSLNSLGEACSPHASAGRGESRTCSQGSRAGTTGKDIQEEKVGAFSKLWLAPPLPLTPHPHPLCFCVCKHTCSLVEWPWISM